MNRFEDVDLKPYNSFGISAKCDLLYKVYNQEQLQEILKKDEGPYFILGGGSNLLISQDQEKTILKNEILGVEVEHEDEDYVILKVGGGENWHDLVLWALEQDYGGLENLSLIPGTVGASPIQNIGAYGVELHQVFHKLVAINIDTRELHVFSKEACEFGYRDSIFKNRLKGQFFITHVFFRLTKSKHKINITYAPLAAKFTETPTIQQVSQAVIEIRQSKLPDPAIIGNSGSFFKNPIIKVSEYERLKKRFATIPSYPVDEEHVKVPAGWLIDQAGWKGKRLNDAGTYEKQALVIVNHGNATGPEIWDFAQRIIADIAEKYGIVLSPEVNII